MVTSQNTASEGRIERAQWHPETSRQIRRRVVIIGTLVLDTPTSLSTGEVEGTEAIILRDAATGGPLLPGASLAGALRAALLGRQLGNRTNDPQNRDDKTYATQLFGEALDDDDRTRMESRVIVHDAPGNGSLTRRDGVKIDGKYRTADDGMLFSTQVWEKGTTFDLRLELILYEGDSDELISAFAAVLLDLGYIRPEDNAIQSGRIRFGGRRSRGYGRVHVENWRACFYDMTDPMALVAWLSDDLYVDHTAEIFKGADAFMDARQVVRIDALFELCDSLLIRAGSDVADNEHLTSNGQPVLSGTSVAGALRARAVKIMNTIRPDIADALVNDLFGRHGAEGETDNLTASRLIVEEHTLEGGQFNRIQNRVKIDRFTGGSFETALFEERPVFADGQTAVRVGLQLDYPADEGKQRQLDAQTGLLLLLLKDLWTEDLALGGESSIGRGRLRGHEGIVYLYLNKPDEFEYPLTVDLNAMGLVEPAAANYMQTYVETLLAITPEEIHVE